jgi:hypothetical protein
MLFPRDQVVNLLDLDVTEPCRLCAELPSPFLDGVGPDLGRDNRLLARLEKPEARGEGCLCAAVHRRGVHEAAAPVEGSADDLRRESDIALERTPGAQAYDRPQAPLLH